MIEEEERHFLDYPELNSVLESLYPSLLNESDRGAILVALSVIDNQLDMLFESIVPDNTPRKRKKNIFNRTGPFGTLSGKLDIAYACRIIPSSIVDSVHILRGIRNSVAHGTDPFSLVDHHGRIREAYDCLGDSVKIGINRIALDTMGGRAVESLGQLRDPGDSEKPMFSNTAEIADALLNHETAISDMERQLPKYELIFAAHLICGLIFMRQRNYLRLHKNAKKLMAIRGDA